MSAVSDIRSIEKSDHVVSKLINNLYQNIDYIAQLKKYTDSDDQKLNKKGESVHKTLSNIRIFSNGEKILFLARDIGILMGISGITYTIKNFDSDEKVDGLFLGKQSSFLTRHGLYHVIFSSQSKSPLVQIIRKFLFNLLDHVILEEHHITNQIALKTVSENPELVKKSSVQLHLQLEKYKTMLDKQQILLEEQDDEINEMSHINNIKSMAIEGLNQEKKKDWERIHNEIIDRTNSDLHKENEHIKNKFMKKMNIYLVSPEFIEKHQKKKSKSKSKSKSKKKKPNSTRSKKIENAKILKYINDDTEPDEVELNDIGYAEYAKDHKSIDINYIDTIFKDKELCYAIPKTYEGEILSDSVKFVKQSWVLNKKHYDITISDLKKNTQNYKLGALNIFKASLDEVDDIISQHLYVK
jgi:prophage antirepressor-like protein